VDAAQEGQNAQWQQREGTTMKRTGIVLATLLLSSVDSTPAADKRPNLIIVGSFGAGIYAMCGKAFDPRLMLAWPTAPLCRDG